MAWRLRFRRSIGNKLFRVNFTKTGVGASAGIPGYRRSWHSSGRKTETVSIPGTGVEWQNVETAKPRQEHAEAEPARTRPTSPPRPPALPGGTVEDALDLADDIDL